METKQNRSPARRDAAQESVGLLEEMNPAAEPEPAEEAAQPSPGCQLTVKLEGRELPQLGESDQRPEWISPGELGVGAGSGRGGRPADGQGCVEVVAAPLHAPPWGDIGIEVVVGMQKG